MSNKISKITKMKLLESFVQVNFLKGFKYIDKAGEILNLYQQESGDISYNMSPDRLLILRPTSDIIELRISNTDFWCHYLEPPNLGEISRTFQKEVNAVLDITQVEELLRIGWRNYYVYDLTKKRKDLNSLVNFSQGKTLLIQTRIDFSDSTKSNIRIKLVQKKTEEEQVGILFDIDTYIEGKIPRSGISKTLSGIKKHIEDDEVKKFINEVLKLLK